MSSTYSWANQIRHMSRRFTNLEGWAGFGLRNSAVANQFDPESGNDDQTSWTRCNKLNHGSDTAGVGWNSDTRRILATVSEKGRSRVDSDNIEEEEYHVFSKSEKWSVVAMIGIAGLFSGLSSNIYFPALDAIAKARSHIGN
jgi:hypothetical protein